MPEVALEPTDQMKKTSLYASNQIHYYFLLTELSALYFLSTMMAALGLQHAAAAVDLTGVQQLSKLLNSAPILC